MPFARTLVFAFLPPFLALPALSQQTATPTIQRDPKALALVAQAVNAGGGLSSLSTLQDFTASGQITYFWPEGDVQGSVVIKGRGRGQLRIDAALAQGQRSTTFNNSSPRQREADGTVRTVPDQSTEDAGTMTFPILQLAAALGDSSVSVTDLGLVTDKGPQEQGIRLQRIYSARVDPGGIRSRMSQRDFFVDLSTFRVSRTLDMLHPEGRPDRPVPHEMVFSDYRSVQNVIVPFSITQTIYRQPTFTIQLEQVNLNAGLADADFAQ